VNRRAFLKATTLYGAALPFLLLHTGNADQAEESRAAEIREGILAEAPDRIERTRKGTGSVIVHDSSGKAVSGATVELEQLRHEFLFGCNFFMFDRCGAPAVEEAYRSRFAAVFNYCTLGFYWNYYEAERGKPNYAYTEKVVDWTRDRGITCKGHPLVWDHPASSPKWLPQADAEVEKLSHERVRQIVTRFKGRIDVWDVVNEATHLPDKVNKTRMADWGLGKGSLQYVSEHLRVARKANPNAVLLINDYRLDPPYYRLLEQVINERPRSLEQALDERPRFDCVGIQSHMHDGAWPIARTWEVCQTYQRLGLPLHFTETTLVSGARKGPGENWGQTTAELEEEQAERTERFYTLLFSHLSVKAITWWDFSDRGA
jgi:GH35 family endo-1,4-beta-xylanase